MKRIVTQINISIEHDEIVPVQKTRDYVFDVIKFGHCSGHDAIYGTTYAFNIDKHTRENETI